jgi:outer membrane protein assembly factor BamA
MSRQKKYLLCFCTFFFSMLHVKAQVSLLSNALIYSTDEGVTVPDTTTAFTIRDILITGNDKTKSAIILRELSFHQGESFPLNVLVDRFVLTKQQLMNTGLFRSVVVSLKSLQGYDVYVSIDVKERWYIYPIPYFKMVDRNINEWVVSQKMSMTRVNYGLKLTHKNTTGRNDKLYLNLVNGYTKHVSLKYDNLFLDKRLRWSANFSTSLGQNHEIVYNTVNDKQVAYKDNSDYVNTFFRSALEIVHRPAIKTKHIFGIGYNYERVGDTLAKLNPHYSNGKNILHYPEMYYRLKYTDVDFLPYPTKGNLAEVAVIRRGLNSPVNLWQLTAKGSAYWPVAEKIIFNLRAAGTVKLPFKQMYVNKQLLGYGDMYMQGFEYNVVDGVAGGYVKGIFSRQLVNTAIHIPSKKIERLNHMPLAIYAKVYGNAGYVHNPQPGDNHLSNTMLYSGGAGIDVVLFADFVFKLEWSLNGIGQKGIYLHNRDFF